MTDIATLLDAYPALSPDERALVDARVASLPEWTEVHAGARHLAALVDAATGPLDADDLARAAVDRLMGQPSADADTIDDARTQHPDLDAEAERVEARLRELDADAEDPVARFERLTGRSVSRNAQPLRLVTDRAPAADRPAAAPTRLHRLRAPRWLAAAAVLVVAYGAAFAVSSVSETSRARVAALDEIGGVPPALLRGEAGGTDDAEALTEAVDAVQDARQSVLGLFVRYDTEALDAAADRLAALVADADPASWVAQEARLAHGRVLLSQGRDAQAARTLGVLVEQGSYRGAAARRLLDAIREGGLDG